MIRVCPHSDSKCPHGMGCTFSCATGDYDGTKRAPTPNANTSERMTPREKVELKPCPFCGGEPNLSTYETESLWSHDQVIYTKVACNECDIAFNTEPGHDPQAFDAWNRRTALASGSGDHAELARLAEAAAKRAPGLWGSDVEKGEGEYGSGDDDRTGFMVPYMETEHGKRLFDAHYCDVAEVHEDYDSDDDGGCSIYAWDQAAKEIFDFLSAVQPSAVLALIAESAALRVAVEIRDRNINRLLDRATEAERKLAEAVADERERGQVIINERDKRIVELIRDRNEATGLLRAAITEAVPDAMIFAGHVEESRYIKAMDDLRIWTCRSRWPRHPCRPHRSQACSMTRANPDGSER